MWMEAALEALTFTHSYTLYFDDPFSTTKLLVKCLIAVHTISFEE